MNFEILKKNKVLLILVGILLFSVGVSLAYFVTKALSSGTGGSITTTTAVINGANIKVEGTLEFNDTDIYPGYMNVSGIKVTATGNNELIPYNLVWKGSNGISQINYKVYKTSSPVTSVSNCEKKMEVVKGIQQYSEECTISNLDKLGTAIESGSIKKNDTKVMLVKDEFITATSDGQIVYYYVVLEYPNLDMNQSDDINATFDGLVTVEESDKKPDINILAIKVEQEDGTYKDSDDIPTEGYVLNTKNSTCSNEAIPSYDIYTKTFTAKNLNRIGTSCYLTFNIATTALDTISKLNVQNIKEDIPIFENAATTDEGVYRSKDGMYGGHSYYWRGAATTNHVIFDNKCWRIVRINGDGSIRLIYNGTPTGSICPGNGFNADSVVLKNTAYNRTSEKNSKYVGWTYSSSSIQRPSNSVPQVSGTNSQLKKALEDWYGNTNNISENAKEKIVLGKFCNDRNIQNNEEWHGTGGSQYYTAHQRLIEGMPTLSCPDGDIYELEVGLISVDEVQFAGASWGNNNGLHYLYNGQYYWTMSPYRLNGSDASVFLVSSNGGLTDGNMSSTYDVRPVINLRSDVTFNVGSDGTQNNPYIVQ